MAKKSKADENSLRNLTDEYAVLKFMTPVAAYKRFDKILKLLGDDARERYKDESGHFCFYPEEKEFLFALMDELEEPYFKNLTNNNSAGKTISEGIENATAFQKRMESVANKIETEDLKLHALMVIEFLSKLKLRQLL